MSNEENKKKEIKVINGDGKDLNISDVYDHIKTDAPSSDKKKKNVIIPKGSSDNSDEKK